ncbi:MAG TPA: aminotransferase class IV [Phnomibacter sp.]|nr:aminotransferase class IV [Phnomibacter sp.]
MENKVLVYLNGAYIDESQAQVSVNNRAFRYGDGFFETIKLVQGKVVNPQLHTDRLLHTLQRLQFDCPAYFTPKNIIDRIEELVIYNQHQALARIRLTVFRGDGSLHDIDNLRPNLLIQSWPLDTVYNQLNENGWVIDVYKEGHKTCDAFANLKSNNYLLYAMASIYARQNKFDDVLVLNEHGRIADATIANTWIVEQGKLVTPTLSEAPVAGTMRRFIVENAHRFGLQVTEDIITIERLKAADELWLTNALYGIRWVKQLGDTTYGNKYALQLHQQLLQPLL